MHVGSHAAQRPDAPALVMAASGAVTTYGELDERATRLAHLLAVEGLRTGDHYALLLENHPRFLEACWAGDRTGLYYTPVSTYLTPDEVAAIVDDCGARVVVTSWAQRDVAAVLRTRCPRVQRWLMLDGVADGFESYEDAVGAQPTTPIEGTTCGWSMLYSSGTTGHPKGVLRPLPGVSPDDDHPFAAMLERLYGVDADTVYLSPAPLYHSAPLSFSLGVQRLGGLVVILERFDAVAALDAIARYHVTHSQWVPTHFSRLLRLPDDARAGADLSSMRVAVHAAAPCPVVVKRQMLDWWGPILHEYYGSTETNALAIITSDEWLAHPGSVGRAMRGALHVFGADGRELPPGEVGEVWFSGVPPFEYHGDPAATAASRDQQGRATVGDLGFLDDDGYLYLTDRRAFTIISGGVNVSPQEAEDVLITHPAVFDVAVIGVPDDDLGERVHAVVQLEDAAVPSDDLADELRAYCRERLSAVRCPRSVEFRHALPRTPTGKLRKRELRDPYWAGRSSRIG